MNCLKLLLFVFTICLAVTSVDAKPKPNIVILYADDMGFGDVSSQNSNSKVQTPHLDRMAAQGMRFTDGHSSSGICTPSRYALLTGRYHWRKFHGIVGVFGKSAFSKERLTMPEMLKQSGYETACIGKWHLGWNWLPVRKKSADKNGKFSNHFTDFDWSKQIPDGPLDHGFDYYFGDTVINFPPYAWIENDKLVKFPDTMMDTSKWKPIKEGRWECRPGPMVSDWDPYEVFPTLTKKSEDYIRSRKGNEKPFFLYFPFPCPHAPIIPNDEFDGKSQAGPYGDFIVQTDAAVGRIIKALEESGHAQNTIVIFTADNGPEKYAYARSKNYKHWSAEPFRGLKRDIYEGGHHVPFIVKWPEEIKGGQTFGGLVSQIDIMATIADIVEYDLPNEAAEDSMNLYPAWVGDSSDGRTSHVHNTFANKFALRHGDWVLINSKDGYSSGRNAEWESARDYPKDNQLKSELYNVKLDPGQKNDLAKANPELVKELSMHLNKLRNSTRSLPVLE